MKKIQVFMFHPRIHDTVTLTQYLHIPSSAEYELEWNENEPDYLIASEYIWIYPIIWKKFLKIYNKARIHIYFAGECAIPDLNIFDYVVCFDKHLRYDDRVCRIPTRIMFDEMIFDYFNSINNSILAHEKLHEKTEFCNYMYSNKYGHKKRTEIFYKINQYKHVDSLGKYLNNKRIPMSAKNGKFQGWREIIRESINIKKAYKFSIAFENAYYPGYTSEKLLSSLEAHTVPVYWGNPLIAEDFNEEAYINCHRYKDFDKVLEQIKRIDEDDELWCHMISQPWLTSNQEMLEKKETEEYYSFLENIFMQQIESAKRRSAGYYPDMYSKFYLHNRCIFQIAKERAYFTAKMNLKRLLQR